VHNTVHTVNTAGAIAACSVLGVYILVGAFARPLRIKVSERLIAGMTVFIIISWVTAMILLSRGSLDGAMIGGFAAWGGLALTLWLTFTGEISDEGGSGSGGGGGGGDDDEGEPKPPWDWGEFDRVRASWRARPRKRPHAPVA
jgi:hypothetical protein